MERWIAVVAGLVSSAAFAAEIPSAIEGVPLGAKIEVLKAKCKGPGWHCSSRAHRGSAKKLTTVDVKLHEGDYRRVVFTARDGVIFWESAYLRAPDAKRHDALAAAHGKSAPGRKGLRIWRSADGGRELGLSADGGRLLLRVTAPPATRPLATQPPVELPPLKPIPSLRLPVSIILDALEVKNTDDGRWQADEGILTIHGLHTNPGGAADPWVGPALKFRDMDEGETRRIDLTLFGARDSRRWVSTGEVVGFHLSLTEWDEHWDDEIDFVQVSFPFSELLAHAGKTLHRSGYFDGTSSDYAVHYRVVIGRLEASPPPVYAYAPVAAQRWAAKYDAVLGGKRGTAVLIYLPAHPAAPGGALSGTFTGADGRARPLVGVRLLGNQWTFDAAGMRGVGYLVGTQQQPSIAGTIRVGGSTAALLMTRKP